MTASLPPVQPASMQPASAAPSVSDSAAPEVPFSQVLSGEMAQQRGRAADAPDGERDPATADAQAGSDTPATSDTPAASTVPVDPLTGNPTAPLDPAMASATPAADTLLALALNPDLQKPGAARTAPATDEADDTPAGGRSLPALGADAAGRSAARTAWADARTARADATAQAADAAREGIARNAAADPAALAARSDTPRTTERLPDFMTALNQAQVSQIQTTQAASTASAPLQASDRLMPQLGTPAWNQALGDKIVWMAAGSQQSATLTLNPPDLGPVQVVLNVSNDQASAHFFAAQPEVRQALEAALPRLREMMQDAGVQLGQANVSADTARQQDNSPRDTPRTLPGFADNGTEGMADVSLAALPARTGRGLVDTFA